MFYVYVLYSEKLDRFYTGQTHDIDSRLEKHNTKYYENKWTSKGIPWSIFLIIECQSKKQSLSIEKHIKRMKSSKYIRNLKKYPELILKLKNEYNFQDC